MSEDKRPNPKPRKLINLWQAYLMWNELVEMRKRHLLRISSIENGKSVMDLQLEHDFLEYTQLDYVIKQAKRTMVNFGKTAGPIWDWLTEIRGLGDGGMAAQLLAQVDDVGKFDTVSKLWRFAGQAVIDGKAERRKKGEIVHYPILLKSLCFLIGDQFIKQQTSGYVDIYYAEKRRLRELYPEEVPNPAYETNKRTWPYNYTDNHIHRMARRKMVKIFLQHFWVTWRKMEGLPVTPPYVEAILGHTHIVESFQ